MPLSFSPCMEMRICRTFSLRDGVFLSTLSPRAGYLTSAYLYEISINRVKIDVCMVWSHFSYSNSMDQPGKVANPARGQLNRENEDFAVPVRA